jgi:hypothetical protein
MRSAASCGQPLHDRAEPRGDRIMRVPTSMAGQLKWKRRVRVKDQKVRIGRGLVKSISKNIFS